MTDIVSDFFRKFYPADWNRAWRMRSIGREYAGNREVNSTIFPLMVCADGFTMSVQGHYGAYSQPRDDFADHYSSVEILCLADPILDEHGGHECGDEKIYGYVPIELVERVIAAHGGLAAISRKHPIMYASNQFMSLKMFGGPPVRSPWWVSVIGPPIVIGMLMAMIVVGVAGKVFGGPVSRPQRRGGGRG